MRIINKFLKKNLILLLFVLSTIYASCEQLNCKIIFRYDNFIQSNYLMYELTINEDKCVIKIETDKENKNIVINDKHDIKRIMSLINKEKLFDDSTTNLSIINSDIQVQICFAKKNKQARYIFLEDYYPTKSCEYTNNIVEAMKEILKLINKYDIYILSDYPKWLYE